MRVIAIFVLLVGTGTVHADEQEQAIGEYCAARAQGRTASERGVPIEACKGLMRGVYQALAARRLAQAVDQLRAVDELMTPRRGETSCAACPSVPVPVPPDAPSVPVDQRRPSDHGVRREPVRPPRAVRRSAREVLVDPFGSPSKHEEPPPAPPRPPPPPAPEPPKKRQARDLTDPFPAAQ